MNILYFHGLDGSLNEEKRKALETYGVVFAPQIDYRASSRIIEDLIESYQNEKIDVVIGSSMGGLAAYYASLAFKTSCLIFNPALPYNSLAIKISKTPIIRTRYLQVVIGQQDNVIRADDNLKFFEKQSYSNLQTAIHVISSLGHQIPIREFKLELSSFFSAIN